MAGRHVGPGKDRPGDDHPELGARKTHGGPEQVYVTGGSVLTPVIGFRGQGVTGTPPAPMARGFTNEPGDGKLPGGKSKTPGGNNALKAFGLQGSSKNDQ
jgi:hypothetical protein